MVLLASIALAAAAQVTNVGPCTTPSAAAVPGITVVEQPGTEPGYRVLRATGAGGAYLLVYFDLGSETAARAWAPCLASQLAPLRAALDDTRSDVEWSSVVFTGDRNYVPPRGPGVKPRWRVETDARGAVDANGRGMVVRVIPHEQVHAWQRRADAVTPRWFTEGQATWVGLKVSAAFDPAIAVKERERMALELTLSKAPLALAAWGSVRPKREAIMRQVSAEDRAKMEADPKYNPQGTFRFTTADLIGDESNMQARYVGAWRVFDGLEQRHGAAKVRAFASAATAAAGRPDLAALTQQYFGESLDALLAEPAK